MKKKAELIFVPVPAVGHLVSAIEFAKILINQNDQILITILVMKMQNNSSIDAYTKSLTSSQPNIQLIHLPQVEPPPLELSIKSMEAYIYEYMEIYKPHVRNVVLDILSSRSDSDSVRVAGLVLDFFCDSMIDVGNELGIPSYIFLTCSAGYLGVMFYVPDRHARMSTEVKISDPEHVVPGFRNPVPSKVLPASLFSTHGGYEVFVKFAERFRDAKGILVNTFAELEGYALKSYSDAGIFPPVYSVGPVLNLKSHPHPDFDHHVWESAMSWLDEQPQSSVLFACFGSKGSFSVAQTKEIAFGLEKSGVKFVWSIRVPPSNQGMSVEDVLPEGFLERVRGRGVICGWAPQVEVLAHKAIGGFLSHCGWNSTLESLWHGVPIVTLPIYAEQQLNAFEMVKEFGLAVDLKMDYRAEYGDFMAAGEIEKVVRCVMENDHDEEREKVKDMGEKAKKAVMEGGSSFTSTAQFIREILDGN